MNANKNALGSDLARVDTHTIQAHEYDELPEITDADLARGTWMINGQPTTEAAARTAVSTRLKKQKINITIDPDVLAWYREQAGGRGYQTLINATLREAMRGAQLAETVRTVIREELQRVS